MEHSKQPKTKLYVAYGSNLNTTQMRLRCPTAKIVGSDILENYQLLFRGGNGNAVATIEPMEGYHVPVLVWEVTAEDEVALDVYEGFPTLYRKEPIVIRLGDERHEAFVYIMNVTDEHGNIREIGKPSMHYLHTILEGYEHAYCADLAEFDANLLLKARNFSEKCYRGNITDQIIIQILTIRDSGETNMLDTENVYSIAVRDGFYELADYLLVHKDEYARFIMTGKAKAEEQ